MKLKELPVSLTSAWSLSRLPLSQLCTAPESQAANCIVSFTSIPSRLGILHFTVRSLLSQTLSPEKVLLWLHHDLAPLVPHQLQKLVCERFEIRYSEQTCAHRKLVESLKVFPDKVIVTCDDDVMYRPGWLESLWGEHLLHPNDIVAHECRSIRYAADGKLAPYNAWQGAGPGCADAGVLAIGYGGTLYPPACLYSDVCKRELYDRLAPRADDLWFKAMSLLQGTTTRRALSPVGKPVPIAFSQQVSLKKHNVRQDGNYQQWQQLDSYYSLRNRIDL